MEINIKRLWSETDYAFFNWKICDKCNFECSYCDVGNVKENFWFSNNYKFVISKLSKINYPFKICLTGGETTLHENLLEIIKLLSKNENVIEILVFTNLSKPINYFKQFNKEKFNKVKLCISFHPEYHKDLFLKKCKELNELDEINLKLNVMLSDLEKFWDKTEVVLNFLLENNIEYSLSTILANKAYNSVYTAKIWKRFDYFFLNSKSFDDVKIEFSNGEIKQYKNFEIEKYSLNNFKGYNCKSKVFRITQQGEIFNECTLEKLPFLVTKESILKTVICPMDACREDVCRWYEKWK